MTAVIGQTVVGTQGLEPASDVGAGLKSGCRRRYVRRFAAFAAAVIVASTAVAQSAQFGTHPATFRSEVLVYGYIAVSSALIIAWFGALVLLRNREPGVVDASLEEPKLRGVRLWLERLEFEGAPGCLALRRISRQRPGWCTLMHVVMHDYAGHPFQVQLSRELAGRGYRVTHQYCTSYTTGRGAVVRTSGDPDEFSVEPLSMSGEFARYSPARRLAQELRYGLAAGQRLRDSGADLVVMSNVPLLAHAVMAAMLRFAGMPMVLWQQDVRSDAIGTAARHRLGRYCGAAAAWIADRLERFISRSSAHVIAISESFKEVLHRWGLSAVAVTVIPNWAPLAEMPVRPRDNEWARSTTWSVGM